MRAALGALSALLAFGAPAYALTPTPTASGLIADWHLDDSGLSAIVDSAGGNNGTNFNATAATGKFNGDFSFNGVNGYIQIANTAFLPSGSSPRTMTAWFKTSNI